MTVAAHHWWLQTNGIQPSTKSWKCIRNIPQNKYTHAGTQRVKPTTFRQSSIYHSEPWSALDRNFQRQQQHASEMLRHVLQHVTMKRLYKLFNHAYVELIGHLRPFNQNVKPDSRSKVPPQMKLWLLTLVQHCMLRWNSSAILARANSTKLPGDGGGFFLLLVAMPFVTSSDALVTS